MTTAIDFYCGMGGTTAGLVAAGFTVVLAANHSQIAISTHSANHPGTEHLCADLQAVDLRRLPRAELLTASPICTEVSPAGGRRRKGHQLDLFEDHGHVDRSAFERTRVTFWEVIRAAELFRYPAVMIENVVEAARWELFDVWLAGMTTLGYRHQFVSVSAAHIGGEGNRHAPQWRDRLYIVFTREGMRRPDVEPRPWAWCEVCGDNVQAVQWWKPLKKGAAYVGRRIGKYGDQYLYVCPVGNHGVVEPYVAPAAAAIDWSDLGQRIGDRSKPLSAATMRRIQVGLQAIGDPALVSAHGNTWDGASGAGNGYLRAWPVDSSPAPSQTTTGQHGLAASGKFVMAVNHDGGRYFDPDRQPMPSRTVKNGEALVAAEPFVTMLRNHGRATSLREPLATFSTARHHGLTVPPGAAERAHASLVIPYRKGSKAHPPSTPLSTVATREAHGLLDTAAAVEDCYFRMLSPREAANAQRFPGSYEIHGNKGEQQMQAGNANPVNVAQWLGQRVLEVL